MPTYDSALDNTKFIPNIVILFKGHYWAMRQPDSGLVIDSDKNGIVTGLTVNPTSIDPFRPTSTISNYSFKLLDKNNVITALFNGETTFFQGDAVDIFVGRIGIKSADKMAFSDYLQLPRVYVNKASRIDNGYTFQAVEVRDRVSTGAFNTQTALAVDILSATTIITVQDASQFPGTGGLCKIEDEFVSFTGTDLVNNFLTGCIRGQRSSTPVAHSRGSTVYLAQAVHANAINILLELLISSGGGGTYDVLTDGAGISQTLIDITQMETIRNEFYSGAEYTFDFALYGVDSLQDFIETQLLYPLAIRLRANSNGKIGLATIDRGIFEIDVPEISDDNMVKPPTYDVDDTKVKNQIRIYWDWSDVVGDYLTQKEYTDATSIATYGAKDFMEFKFKGPQTSLTGNVAMDTFALLFLQRFSNPNPLIKAYTFQSASGSNLGDKIDFTSLYVPNTDNGELNFASSLEVLQRAINYETGDCSFQLSFTSFTGIRSCYISPSDLISSHSSQSIVTLSSGRGANWRAGWKVRLYDNTTRDDANAQINTILSVVGDVVTFVDPWATTLVNSRHRIRFANYDEGITDQQKRFCYISDDGNNFADGKKSYQVLFG